MTDLDAQLLAAHAANDTPALVSLYHRAATLSDSAQARAFFLTQAHVFALEINHPDTPHLRAMLVAMGRETPL